MVFLQIITEYSVFLCTLRTCNASQSGKINSEVMLGYSSEAFKYTSKQKKPAYLCEPEIYHIKPRLHFYYERCYMKCHTFLKLQAVF